MNFFTDFLSSPKGQVVSVVAVLTVGIVVMRSQHRPQAPLPAATRIAPPSLPKTYNRDGARFPLNLRPKALVNSNALGATPAASEISRPQPLSLVVATVVNRDAKSTAKSTAPFGRLIPCETVITLESNRLETPIIGLVTEDLWHDGKLIVPAGAEVHGRAALDRTRERLATQGQWRIVWRTPNADNGTTLVVDGLVLDRDYNAADGTWGLHDGSAGLRGQIVRSTDDRELKLFAATFLATAASALQDTRAIGGLLGETALPAATARNATLAGTSAVLREYAQGMREAIMRDGFFLRVPAGKPFYLYITQNLERVANPTGARESATRTHHES